MKTQTSVINAAELTPWQKRQAAMLYYFSSVAYLAPLHQMVSDIINNVADPALALAKNQERDKILSNKRWGGRDTSQNWSNNAWPFLKDLQSSLARDIAGRQNGEYRRTSVNDCLRGIDEYSTDWMTQGEEQKMQQTLAKISDYAMPYDHTLDTYQNWWDDYGFFSYFRNFANGNTTIPLFRVRHDITAATGEVPPLTGVYTANDDSYANMQFVWTENGGARLRNANTLNDVGLAALAEVGRRDLWVDDSKMFNFAMSEKYAPLFRSLIVVDGQTWPRVASATVASCAFKSIPRKWSLVEIIPGEREAIEALDLNERADENADRRVEGGSPCLTPGYYFTPSSMNTRRFFNKDEIFPSIHSDFGITYWQWDQNQRI